ncbi:DUF2607 family protein [Vibrio sonorensis]|uniref:DUF2607 family protein n=1 Tax=Vibrio sonorensis TaxID=1004316 RepID=UPI0008D997DD|nr:DUF2607 family protein [Vibrio sonorensis]
MYRSEWIVACTLALVLWTGFAYMDHQADLTHKHDGQHDCQLLAASAHGSLASGITWLDLSLPDAFFEEFNLVSHQWLSIPFRARSPPN